MSRRPCLPPYDRRSRDERVVDAVLAAAAHEFKTPLAIVRAHAQLLQRRCRATDESVATITRQVDRLTHLVQQCLEFSRVRLGGPRLSSRSFDLTQVIADSVRRAAALAPSRSVQVAEVEPARVRGDPERMAHAITCLLDNALRYSSEGAPVRVSVWRRERHVAVSIRDEGVGIPPDLHTRLSNDAIRARGQRRDHGGMGLGLLVCNHIVEAHGGALSFSRNRGSGSTFTVVLPSADVHASLARGSRSTTRAPRVAAPLARPAKRAARRASAGDVLRAAEARCASHDLRERPGG